MFHDRELIIIIIKSLMLNFILLQLLELCWSPNIKARKISV